MKVLVTGAGGFVGTNLVSLLSRTGRFELIAATRNPDLRLPAGVEIARVPDLSREPDWGKLLHGVDVVIHAAAAVHRSGPGGGRTAETRIHEINATGTARVAAQAADAGVKRFILVSTIKVNGECSRSGSPFRADGAPHPVGAYAVSKRMAECDLREIARARGMEYVIVRPPLIYGPGVKANFLNLMRWIDRSWPLPRSGNDAHRSFVYVGNFVSLLDTCILHPKAGNQTLLVSDGEDLTFPELASRLALGLGRSPRFIYLSPALMELMARIPAAHRIAGRLFAPLQVDVSATRNLLGWSPPYAVDEGLSDTVRWYLQSRVRGMSRDRAQRS